ncbi:hypothetical protein KASHIRA_02510 [Serratia phage vB_SmaM-Kashira]|nr:hypothetical protein KASHIRA_02510 [Serratia phage vB_SmaM-Kashira]
MVTFEEMNNIISIERVKIEDDSKPLRIFRLKVREDGSMEHEEQGYALTEESLNTIRQSGYDIVQVEDIIAADMPARIFYDLDQLAATTGAVAFLEEEARRLRLAWDIASAKRVMEEEEKKESLKKSVAVLGLCGVSGKLIRDILAERHGVSCLMARPNDVWDFPQEMLADTPQESWKQTKLRRGPGHNKFSKRKGKKK